MLSQRTAGLGPPQCKNAIAADWGLGSEAELYGHLCQFHRGSPQQDLRHTALQAVARLLETASESFTRVADSVCPVAATGELAVLGFAPRFLESLKGDDPKSARLAPRVRHLSSSPSNAAVVPGRLLCRRSHPQRGKCPCCNQSEVI